MSRRRTTPAREMRVLREKGHVPRKSLGQNFLVDPNLLRKIAAAAALTGRERVVEIGSGPGTLTDLLAGAAAELFSVEIDPLLVARQKERLRERANVRFVHADFLEFDLPAAAAGEKLVVVGNIPYQATSPILGKLLRHAPCIDRALLCLQKEVALRIVAPPGTRDFGRLALALRYRTSARVLFRIGPEAFRPRPRVDSAVVALRFLDPPPVRVADEAALFELARALFSERRKMIRSGLRRFRALTADEMRRIEERSGVDLSQRPEALDVAGWCRLSDAVGGV